MYAVIQTGGKQYLVKSGETIKIEKIEGDAGSNIEFDKVLLTANEDGSDVKIGTPFLEGVSIKAKVEKQGRDKKIRVVKYKSKIRYKRVLGHRQHKTTVTIA